MIYVVTPTYNERANLPVLVEKIFALKIPDLQMIIVDDNSPDGTGQLAEELAKQHPIKVIHRSGKQGLGTAYIEAFKQILSSPQDDKLCVIQMDADLSHDPSAIPQLLKNCGWRNTLIDTNKSTNGHEYECDLVLGSRYVQGGRTENWGFIRKTVSRFGNFYARMILGLPYRDLTGGYKCFRAEVLKNINLDSLSSVGYNFQIETTYRAHQKNYKICEVPITFTERKTGVSKFNFGIMLEAFWRVLLLRFKK